jgi:regulatory protein
MPDRPANKRARKPPSLKAQALALLAQREHSELELRRKLTRRLASAARTAAADPPADEAAIGAESVDPAARIDDTIAWLRTHQYLSDSRFIESRVHARAARYGNLRIRQELAQHGVTLDAAAAHALKESEFERAREVWRRKFGEPATDPAGRARQARFLAQRGFSPELVSRLLRSLGRGAEDDELPG